MLPRAIVYITTLLLLISCQEVTTPNNPVDDDLVKEYFWNQPVGTVNVLAVVNTTVNYVLADSAETKYFWYYKIIKKNAQLPSGGTGTLVTTWFSDSPNEVDTIYYFVSGRSIYFTYPSWTTSSERGLVLTMPVQVGDSLKMGRSDMNTHKVIAVNQVEQVKDARYECVILQSKDTTVLAGDDRKYISSQELYFSRKQMQVKSVVNRITSVGEFVEKRSSSYIELVEVVPPK
ncbi:MAG: hypothetical protein HQ472_04910 [Ignavibacteria bacterium]|nr:hypothetical protein [Ignavibacteria bacterium]